MEHLSALYDEYGEDLVIISISTDLEYDTVARLESYKEEHDIKWTIARDTKYVYWYKYNVEFTPTLVLVDWEGNARYTHIRGITDSSILSGEIVTIPEFPAVIVPLVFIILALVVVTSPKLIQLKRQKTLRQINALASHQDSKPTSKNHS